MLLGGLSLILGAWTRIGAFFLLVFIVAATYYFHDFWKFADPTQQQLQTIQFMKNMAIGGGLLSLIAFGGGPWSVDGWIAKRREEVESGAPAAKPRVTEAVTHHPEHFRDLRPWRVGPHKSDTDLVTTWDPLVKSNTELVFYVVELVYVFCILVEVKGLNF